MQDFFRISIFLARPSVIDIILNSRDSFRRKTDPNGPDGEPFLHCDDPIQAIMVLLRTESHYLARVGTIVHWMERESRREVSQGREYTS